MSVFRPPSRRPPSRRPPSRRAALALIASLAMAACSNEQAAAPDGFKPVPIDPVLGDVPMGSDAAPVTIVEYASYTCSHCRDFWKQTFPRLKANYIDAGKVKFIYKDFPLDDSLAPTLAAVSRCGGRESYFAVVDDIFTHQYEILDAAQKGAAGPILLGVAERHGVSADQLRTCIDHSPQLRDAILKSRAEGASRGVNSTPAIFLNDERVDDHSYEGLSALIDSKLNPDAAQEEPTEGGPASAAGD